MKILSSISHLHVVPIMFDFIFSAEYKKILE